jgi:hypothetical protein
VLRSALGVLFAVALGCVPGTAASAAADPSPVDVPCYGRACEPPPGDSADAVVRAGSAEVTVWGSGVTSDGGTFEIAVQTVGAAPACGYRWFATGQEYAAWWTGGSYDALLGRLPAEDQFTPWTDYLDHQDDTEGAWWIPGCSDADWSGTRDEFIAYRDAYFAAHDPVYVEAGEDPPAGEVSPQVLAQIAYESMDLPTGTIRWNPQLAGSGATIINTDTWVWVAGAPVAVAVTAQIPSGMWARVDAQLSGLELSAPGAEPASCPDAGTPWSAGATGTSCSLVFYRSSANQPVKAGQALPTATMSATATWSASWVSSMNPVPTALPAQEITTTAEVPVAEIQALVTTG